MKLKQGFVTRKIAGKDIVLPTGDDMNLNQMISLNDTGMFIWQHLQNDTTAEAVARAVSEKYEISYDDAYNHVSAFIAKLESYGYLEK